MTAGPFIAMKRNDTRKYSLWAWTRAYLVLVLWLPFIPLLALCSGRTLPPWLTRKLLLAHQRYTLLHPMDFRIPPDEAIPAYMDRWWRIPRNWATNCYFHIVRRSDEDRAHHDHPWLNFSIVLDGGYYEHEIAEGGVERRTWRGPGAMKFRWTGRKAHRLELVRTQLQDALLIEGGDFWRPDFTSMKLDTVVELPARTIFITGPVLRRWGFHDSIRGWVDAYDWDKHCDEHGLNGMRMDGGSDAAVSSRNKI